MSIGGKKHMILHEKEIAWAAPDTVRHYKILIKGRTLSTVQVILTTPTVATCQSNIINVTFAPVHFYQ